MKKRYVWTAEGLERRARYLWSDELISMLYGHLRVEPGNHSRRCWMWIWFFNTFNRQRSKRARKDYWSRY